MINEMTDATASSERRAEERKRPLGLVYVELSAANGGMLRDVSEKGFAMRAMMPLRPGDSTPFHFSLDPETRLEGECKVLWVEEDGRVAGLEFTSIPKELPHTVRAWLRENSFATPPSAQPTKVTAPENSTFEELRDELRSITPKAHKAERAERKSASLYRERDSKVEPPPVPRKEKQVAGAGNVEPRAVEMREPVKHLPEIDPLPELETLQILSETQLAPQPEYRDYRFGRSGISMAIRMMVGLALLACGFVYHRPLGEAIVWLGQKIAGSNAPEISYAPRSDESMPVQTTAPSPAANATPMAGASNQTSIGGGMTDNATATPPEKKDPEAPQPVVENESSKPAKNPAATATIPVPVPATNRITTYSAPSSAATDQSGQQEYLAAQDILRSKGTESASTDAVRLLWAAVEKGNSNAEVALAELYWTGHGVSKSCDQSRILLTAAAKKGNADAQKRLDHFLKEGCE